MTGADGEVPIVHFRQITAVLQPEAFPRLLVRDTLLTTNTGRLRAATTTLTATMIAMTGEGVGGAAYPRPEIGVAAARTKMPTTTNGDIGAEEVIHLHREALAKKTTITEAEGDLGEENQDRLAQTVARVRRGDADTDVAPTLQVDGGDHDLDLEATDTATAMMTHERSDGTVRLDRNPVSDVPSRRTGRNVAVDTITTTTKIRIGMMTLWRKIASLRKVQSTTLKILFRRPRGEVSARRTERKRKRVPPITVHRDDTIVRRVVIGAEAVIENPIRKAGRTMTKPATMKILEREDRGDGRGVKAPPERMLTLPRKTENIIEGRVSESDAVMYLLVLM